MKTIKNHFANTLLFVLLFNISNAQQTKEQAKNYFGNYKTSKSMNLLISLSFPTLEECKLVLKDGYAQTYFDYCKNMKEKIATELQKEGETFVEVGIETFVTKDIKDGKGNYAGGMSRILPKLQNNITFYNVKLLRKTGDDSGMTYKYWVYINNHWVFFSKPWQAFKE